ncbi:MAG: hypothetical protein KGJ02_04795 [Verrucomicrobiota bacterium]|nr:hypothetical protein [Verrucomicrobiota bacterium]
MKILIFWFPLLAWCVPFYYPPRGSIAPFISGDTFRAYCDFAFDELLPRFHPGLAKGRSTIFVSGEMLGKFFEKMHPHIRFPYILITHNTDNPAPGAYRKFLEDPKIVAWFAQNQDAAHQKLHGIPIGLENRQWNPSNVEILERVKAQKRPKMHLLYCNFSPTSYRAERVAVYEQFSGAPYCLVSERKNYEAYVEDLASSKFVLSPRGNGLDTHRMWETLYVESFPVVKSSTLDTLYEGLPVLIVRDWAEVTEEFLQQKYEEMSHQTFSFEKLYTDFWFRWIDSFK